MLSLLYFIISLNPHSNLKYLNLFIYLYSDISINMLCINLSHDENCATLDYLCSL